MYVIIKLVHELFISKYGQGVSYSFQVIAHAKNNTVKSAILMFFTILPLEKVSTLHPHIITMGETRVQFKKQVYI